MNVVERFRRHEADGQMELSPEEKEKLPIAPIIVVMAVIVILFLI